MTDWSKLKPPANDATFTIPNSIALHNQQIGRIERHKNKVPTHDPYSNPDAHIYYQCSCGAILDPGTKSFAQLNNVAMDTIKLIVLSVGKTLINWLIRASICLPILIGLALIVKWGLIG
jgi:hypothetical protein